MRGVKGLDPMPGQRGLPLDDRDRQDRGIFATPPFPQCGGPDADPRRGGGVWRPRGSPAAEALAAELGGSFTEEDAHALRVEDTALGTLIVEVEMRYAHSQRHPGTR